MMIQGVPINMGIKWRLLNHHCSMRDYFVNINFVVLTSKTTNLGICKMWSTIFHLHNWRRYQVVCPDSSLLKTNKTVQMFNISVSFKHKNFGKRIRGSFIFLCTLSFINYRKPKTIFKSSFNFHVYWDTLHTKMKFS